MKREEAEKKFPIGTEVKITVDEFDSGDFWDNSFGKVVGYDDSPNFTRIGVEFDDWVIDMEGDEVGHNCKQQGEEGKCWWVDPEYLEIIGNCNPNSGIVL